MTRRWALAVASMWAACVFAQSSMPARPISAPLAPPRPPISAPVVSTPPVKGLPADAPQLVINGGIYSESRDMRMAIVNGSVVREGADVGGVVVEQIRPEGVVLAYRGARYRVMY